MRGGERIGGDEVELTAEERAEKQRRLGAVALEGMESEQVAEDKFAPLKEQWGVMSDMRYSPVVEFERAVSWEEFQKKAEELWQIGQTSEVMEGKEELAWQNEIEGRIDDLGWALPWRLRDYNMLKVFGDLAAEGRCFYGDMSVKAAKLSLTADYLKSATDPLETAEWNGFEADPTLLHLSYDKFDEDGKRISGLRAERPTDEKKAVTLVFNDEIATDEDFQLAAKYPALGGMWRLRKNLVAMVAKDEKSYEEMSEIAESRNLPLFTEQEWIEGGEELLQKTVAEQPERAKAYYDGLRQERKRRVQEQIEQDKKMHKEVFDEVNVTEVDELIGQFAERLDRYELMTVREEMKRDRERGALQMARYMTEVLELEHRPQITYVADLGGTRAGECERHKDGDRIRLSRKFVNLYNYNEQIETMAHECWHSRQHMVTDGEEGFIQQDRRRLYEYNFSNYADADKDFEKYYSQLVEVEARAFGAAVREVLEGEGEDERLKQEVFENVDRAEARRVVEEAMSGLRVKDMLRMTGLRNMSELLKGSAGEVVPRLIRCFNEKMGQTEPLKTVTMLSGGGEKIVLNWAERTFEMGENINQAPMTANILRWFLRQYWWCNRKDFLNKEPYDERGELYEYNFENYKVLGEEGAEKQLLEVETEEFIKVFAEKLMEPEMKRRNLMGKIRGILRGKGK